MWRARVLEQRVKRDEVTTELIEVVRKSVRTRQKGLIRGVAAIHRIAPYADNPGIRQCSVDQATVEIIDGHLIQDTPSIRVRWRHRADVASSERFQIEAQRFLYESIPIHATTSRRCFRQPHHSSAKSLRSPTDTTE